MPYRGVFNAELLAAERRRDPTASLAVAPARPLPAPRPTLPCPALSVKPHLLPKPLGPEASAQPPGPKWRSHLSIKDVLPEALRRRHCFLPIKSVSLGWARTSPAPYATAPGANFQSRKCLPLGKTGRKQTSPGKQLATAPASHHGDSQSLRTSCRCRRRHLSGSVTAGRRDPARGWSLRGAWGASRIPFPSSGARGDLSAGQGPPGSPRPNGRCWGRCRVGRTLSVSLRNSWPHQR